MLISELIAALQEQMAVAGDVPVFVETGDDQVMLSAESVVAFDGSVALDLTA